MEKITLEKIDIGSQVGIKVNCSMCKKEGTTDEFVTLQGEKDQNIYLCLGCKDKANQSFEDETKNPNILLAVVVGAIAALVGGIVWYYFTILSGFEIGYVSLGLGYLVGFGVYYGAGKKRGHKLQIISALITVIAIILIEKFILDHLANEYLQNNPTEFPDIPIDTSISVSIFSAGFWESFVSPIGLLIYAIGVYLAYGFCKPKKIA